MLSAKLYKLGFWSIWAGILIACLWPFHSPANRVAWLASGNGLRFGRHGTLVSRGALTPGRAGGKQGFTLEIWLRPKHIWASRTILAFYDPRRPGGFSLHLSDGYYLAERELWNRKRIAAARKFYVGRAFRRFTFLTLISGFQGTKAYIDGSLVRAARQFQIPSDALSGRLVVANSPVLNDSWSGELKGLALYSRALTTPEVLQDYKDWMRTGWPGIAQGDGTVALYVFDERSGRVVRNHWGPGGDLVIPKRYVELHHTLLRSPWDEYSPDWGYWKDVLINIGGFMPLGFFCYAYLSSISLCRRLALVTVIFGCIVSLTVEVLQTYLPTRDSGMTDVITNTLGTGLGILLFRCAYVVCQGLARSRYAKVRYLAGLFADNPSVERNQLERAGTPL
jgi:VanZ family protein